MNVGRADPLLNLAVYVSVYTQFGYLVNGKNENVNVLFLTV
jgi:hypothetical protein